SWLVTPSRRPVSRSARRTHARSVSAVQPNLAAIEPSAAHCDGYSDWCSNTIRTARSLTSGEYLVCLLMTPSSQEMEPPGKPGRFTCAVANKLARRLWAAEHHRTSFDPDHVSEVPAAN